LPAGKRQIAADRRKYLPLLPGHVGASRLAGFQALMPSQGNFYRVSPYCRALLCMRSVE
jgi:hypothetical protein